MSQAEQLQRSDHHDNRRRWVREWPGQSLACMRKQLCIQVGMSPSQAAICARRLLLSQGNACDPVARCHSDGHSRPQLWPCARVAVRGVARDRFVQAPDTGLSRVRSRLCPGRPVRAHLHSVCRRVHPAAASLAQGAQPTAVACPRVAPLRRSVNRLNQPFLVKSRGLRPQTPGAAARNGYA